MTLASLNNSIHMKKLLLSVIFFSIILVAISQERSSFKPEDFKKDENYGYFNYWQAFYHFGSNPTSSIYLQDPFSSGFQAFELRIGTQSTGRQLWQQYHNYPQYGLGFYMGDMGNKVADTLIGKPSALFFYFGAPIVRFGRFTFNTDISIGLSYDFNAYDPVENPTQNVIGSSVNLYFNLSLMLYYRLSERLDLSISYSLTHFSNGRTFTPQQGINTMGLGIGLKYNINPVYNYTKAVEPDYRPAIRPEYVVSEKPVFKPYHELTFMGSVGTVLTERPLGEPKGIRYLTSSVSGDWAYQFARKMNAGAGVDIFYDGSLVESYPDWETSDISTLAKMSFGAHVGFQYQIERFSFLYNLGFYLYKESPARGGFYMRAGGRIQVTDNLYAHVCLKTMNGGIADWIEWGMAYRLKLGRKN